MSVEFRSATTTSNSDFGAYSLSYLIVLSAFSLFQATRQTLNPVFANNRDSYLPIPSVPPTFPVIIY